MADVTAEIAGNEPNQTAELDALVIGAGFAGLYQLLRLRDRLGLSVKALEAGGGVGGSGDCAAILTSVCVGEGDGGNCSATATGWAAGVGSSRSLSACAACVCGPSG